MKLLKLFGSVCILTGAMLVTGCVTDFTVETPEIIAESENESVSSFEKSLNISEKPAEVAMLVKPDKSIYNPMTFEATVGFSEIYVLNSNDFFSYDVPENSNFKTIDSVTEPTNISVRYYPYGYDSSNGCFSCFVYKIDDEYIYLGTAGHCVVKESDRKNCEISFFDRSKVRLSLQEYKMGHNFKDTRGDYAMYRIPTDIIPRDVLVKLKTVKFDVDHISTVKNNDIIYTGNIYARNPAKDYEKEMQVLPSKGSFAEEVINQWNWIGSDKYFVVSGSLVGGQSGSAFFDKEGYLVGIASGTGTWNGSKYSIVSKAQSMEELYQSFLKGDE